MAKVGDTIHFKYRNKITELDGHRFHSQKEANRYAELKMMEKGGLITDLELQPCFLLQEAFTKKGKRYRKIEYSADFRYKEDGQEIVEDVKSWITKKNPTYAIKKKLLLYKYNIIFKET